MHEVNYWMLRARLAVLSLLNPWRAVRQLREENKRLVETITEPLLTGIKIGNGSVDIGFQGGFAAQLLAGMFLGTFEKYPDAKNYIEVTFSSPEGPIMVTVVRPGGKTPHQLLLDVRQELQGVDTCPDCGRQKAHSADDCCKGFCSKWYAIRDRECKEECEGLTRERTRAGEESARSSQGLEAWLPIDTAPKDGTLVDLLYQHQVHSTNCFYEQGMWQARRWDGTKRCVSIENPSHWRRPPEAP